MLFKNVAESKCHASQSRPFGSSGNGSAARTPDHELLKAVTNTYMVHILLKRSACANDLLGGHIQLFLTPHQPDPPGKMWAAFARSGWL
jgi:hypothetical protein